MYRVIKVLNNNGILVLDDANGQEQILLGNGVGFGHRMGERMAELPKGRRYELVSEKTPALIRVNGIDPIYIEAAGKIINKSLVRYNIKNTQTRTNSCISIFPRFILNIP